MLKVPRRTVCRRSPGALVAASTAATHFIPHMSSCVKLVCVRMKRMHPHDSGRLPRSGAFPRPPGRAPGLPLRCTSGTLAAPDPAAAAGAPARFSQEWNT